MLPQLLGLADQLQASPLRALAKTLQSWLEPIVGMWRFTENNGITEGFQTKMELCRAEPLASGISRTTDCLS